MGLLILEGAGPRAEELAMAAGEMTEVAVGWDSEFDSATFDSDLPDEELEAVIFDALGSIDPDWRSHLQITE